MARILFFCLLFQTTCAFLLPASQPAARLAPLSARSRARGPAHASGGDESKRRHYRAEGGRRNGQNGGGRRSSQGKRRSTTKMQFKTDDVGDAERQSVANLVAAASEESEAKQQQTPEVSFDKNILAIENV